MLTIYKCNRCNIFETGRFGDIKKHLFRKNVCKKNEKNIFLSDDQILCMSIISYYKNIHNINEDEIKLLKDSNILDINKKELFDKLDNIEKNNCKKCNYCNKEFSLINDLKKHFILYCFKKELENRKNKEESNKTNNINSNNNNCDLTNININTLNQTNNITNITNLYFEIKSPIPFDKDWDISKIDEDKKAGIIISNYMYTKLLEEILKNEINLNVIIDKEKELGMVYQNDKYIQMKLKDIISNTMEKLNNHLNEINKENNNVFDEIVKFSRQMINKKYVDFNNKQNIQEGVKKCLSEIFENKKEEAVNIAKNICENKKEITFEGF
jgi:hypothetical protein